MSNPQLTRAFWLRHLHRWHWISAALSLAGMLLFAATGITLNHAAHIEARPDMIRHRTLAPPPLIALLVQAPERDGNAVPTALSAWLEYTWGLHTAGRAAEWSADEIYIALPRPGGDAWVSLDLRTREVQYERTTRGSIAFLNDLHKGRNTGAAWSVFLDVFSVACVVFCITGLFLLKLHGRGRVATWPLAGLGLAVPLVLAILFIH